MVVALPGVLVRYIGWPLPDHLPSTDELTVVLLQPMSTGFLLDALACLAWLLWFCFVLDVLACAVELARGARWSELARQSGPLRRVAAVLIGALLVAVLGRTATAAPAATAGGSPGHAFSPIVATAPAWHTPAIGGAGASAAAGAQDQTRSASAGAVGEDTPPGTERARLPENGVHDSLWRIADRCLGDGSRWPEIWALNQGSTQPGGRVLTNPHLIQPGDLFRLPTHSSTQPGPDTDSPVPHPAPPPSVPREPVPSTPPPPSESHSPGANTPVGPPAATHADPADGPAAEPSGGVSWGTEVFVSLGLATAVSAALLLLRRRHNARYRPGSGRRDDHLPVAPVVYQLRLAHLQAQHQDDDRGLVAEASQLDRSVGTSRVSADDGGDTAAPHRHCGSVRVLSSTTCRVVGSRATPAAPGSRSVAAPEIALECTLDSDASKASAAAGGQLLALDLARAHGLGLVGPGGYAAARALVLTMLTGHPAATLVIPADDLACLLGVPARPEDLPTAVRVVDDLATGLDLLEPHVAPPQGPADADSPAPLVLIASASVGQDERVRLQGLLDNGGQAGVAAVLLGQWQPGVTAYVTSAGIISATDPGLGESLRGSRAFTLPDTVTRDLLTLLRDVGATHRPRDVGQHRAPQPPSTAPAVSPVDHTEPALGSERNDTGLEITSGATAPADEETTPAPSPNPDPTTDPPAGGAAGRADAAESSTTVAPILLSAFGTPTLAWRPDLTRPEHLYDISAGFSPRLLELLMFLAVQPGGVSRDAIVDAVWHEHVPQRPAAVLRTVLSRIRSAVSEATDGTVTELVLTGRHQYRLDPALVETDYRAFADAVARGRAAATDLDRLAAYEEIVDRYGGPLADGFDTDWLTAAREGTRRDALDAVAALARARVRTDPDYTLDLLEIARAFDPHNELLYRDIMRLQHTLGRHEAISRTLSLLETRLAEIDTTPTPETVDLARRLREHHTDLTDPEPDDRPRR